MRLIDADALSDLLVKTYETAPTEKALLFVALLLKNNEQVPTVEPTFGLFKEMLCAECEKRTQGEWIRTGSLGNGNAHYECSNCHHGDEHAESQEVPYCWFCGAKMKKGGKE